MIRSAAVLMVLMLAAPPAAAEWLYKCTDDKGAVSVQSQACPKGSTEVWKRDASPDPGPSPDELAARALLAQEQAARAAETARLAEESRLAAQALREQQERQRAAAASSVPPPRKSECTKAHEFSDLAGTLPWLDLTQAQREAIRRWVIEHCRDPEPPLAEATEL